MLSNLLYGAESFLEANSSLATQDTSHIFMDAEVH
jgi:hypothetical protein